MTPRRALLLPAALILLALALAALPIDWPLDDFVEYWAAGRLNASGQNPYEPSAMLQQERRVGWQQPDPDMMYNPPWTLALAMPMSAAKIQTVRSIWLPAQLLVTLWCAATLWTLYGGSPVHSARAGALALLWMPTLVALRMGQLSPIILLGLVGFLRALDRRRDFAAGVFFALTLVKPQLVALVWVPFVLWTVVEQRWKILAGAIVFVAAASLAAMSTNPAVFAQYQHLVASAPPTLTFESPNLATILRAAMRTMGSWPQFVPTALGAIVVALMWFRARGAWEWKDQLPGLVLISFLLTSYGGWAFDLVVLLIPVMATAAILARSGRPPLVGAGAAAFVGISGAAFAMHAAHAPQAAFLWMTPAVARLLLA